MATKAVRKTNKNNNSMGTSSDIPSWIPPPVVPVSNPLEESPMWYLGWVAATVLVAILLPINAILFSRAYETELRAKAILQKTEQIQKQIERKQSKSKDD